MTVTMSLDINIRNPFASIFAPALLQGLRDVQLHWAERIRARVEVYPARRAGQIYIRTYVFRDAWRITPPQLRSGNLETSVTNDTPYAVEVVGDDLGNLQNQAYHAGRWYLLRQIIEQSEAQLRQEAQDVINRVLAPATITP